MSSSLGGSMQGKSVDSMGYSHNEINKKFNKWMNEWRSISWYNIICKILSHSINQAIIFLHHWYAAIYAFHLLLHWTMYGADIT